MSTLHVENLKGLSSGSNANKIIVPSGQTLTAPGHVVQFVETSSTTQVDTSSSGTWVDAGQTITITPKSATSKLYMTIFAAAEHSGAANQGLGYRIMNGSTIVYDSEYDIYHSNLNDQKIDKIVLLHIESAANTTARTYTLQFRVRGNGLSRHSKYGEPSRMVIIEIAQ